MLKIDLESAKTHKLIVPAILSFILIIGVIFLYKLVNSPRISLDGPREVKLGSIYNYEVKVLTHSQYNQATIFIVSPAADLVERHVVDLAPGKAWTENIKTEFLSSSTLKAEGISVSVVSSATKSGSKVIMHKLFPLKLSPSSSTRLPSSQTSSTPHSSFTIGD